VNASDKIDFGVLVVMKVSEKVHEENMHKEEYAGFSLIIMGIVTHNIELNKQNKYAWNDE
jgi:hypothetical protein